MNVEKIAVNTSHRKWCQNFMAEQNKTTNMVRQFLKRNSIYNPFGNDKVIDNILKKYEKNFFG